ncbi:MAG: hypothetical protein JNJ61_26970 [Anaerolineae bacterium]|nr:hypothetical protein [Anaerolineae bacterium]
MRIRRRNSVWLAIIGALTGIAVLSGVASAPVTAALLALFVVALIATLVEVQPRQILQSVSSSPLTMMKMSSQAREATERARRRSAYIPPGLTLLDIGLISLHSSFDGMVMRRGRSVSLDDRGVRPYITLSVGAAEADRHAIVRFEIIDSNGQTQYVHEMKTYLRDGEINVLADHLLPLAGNEKLREGEWDLRVMVDGAVLGLLSFTALPSIAARQRMIDREANAAAIRLQDEIEDDSPVSLHDLLRDDAQNRAQRR